MTRMIFIAVAMVATAAVTPLAGAQETKQKAKPHTHAFLKQAGEMQRVQISLALLVDERAVNTRVREFAEQMIAIHKKLLKEVEKSAAEKEVPMPAEFSEGISRNSKNCRNCPATRLTEPTWNISSGITRGMCRSSRSTCRHWNIQTCCIGRTGPRRY